MGTKLFFFCKSFRCAYKYLFNYFVWKSSFKIKRKRRTTLLETRESFIFSKAIIMKKEKTENMCFKENLLSLCPKHE